MQDHTARFIGEYSAMVAGYDLDADMLVEREQIFIIAAAENS